MPFTMRDVDYWRRTGVVALQRDEIQYPRDLIDFSQYRETARVLAVAMAVFPGGSGAPLRNLTPCEGMPPGVHPRTEEWAEVTGECLSSGEPFWNGLLLCDDIAVVIDRGDYHSRMEGWEFRLYRPATGIRSAYEHECSAVACAAEKCGIPVAGIFLVYLEKSMVLTGDPAEWRQLFRESNLTRRANRLVPRMAADIVHMRKTVPEPRISRGGSRQKDSSSGEITDVLTLHKGRDLGRKLLDQGISDLRDPALDQIALTPRQQVQVQAVREGQVQIDRRGLGNYLETIRWPCAFLDFEAYSQSVPPFDRLRPYEHVPVLASVHRQKAPGGPREHQTHCAEAGRESRADFLKWIHRVIAPEDTVIVFSKTFEAAMVRQLAREAGEREYGESLVGRMVDLLVPFADFLVYHPEQRGKVSLKRVLPAFTDHAYDGAVQDGMQANVSLTMAADAAVTPDDPVRYAGARAALASDRELARVTDAPRMEQMPVSAIVQYCSLDTLAMVAILEKLYNLIS